MTTKSPVTQLREMLAKAQTDGETAVTIQSLLSVLEEAEHATTEGLEMAKVQYTGELEAFRIEAAAKIETFRSVIETAKGALSTSILINGGATVALLAFLGTLAKAGASMPHSAHGIVVATGFFAVGVLLGGGATGLTFFTQANFNEGNESLGRKFRKAAILVGTAAYLAFAVGIAVALVGFWSI